MTPTGTTSQTGSSRPSPRNSADGGQDLAETPGECYSRLLRESAAPHPPAEHPPMKSKPGMLDRLRVSVAERALDFSYGVRSLFYRGEELYCPCCEREYNRFMSYGGREQCLCPGCRSFERHRLMWLYIERRTRLLEAPHRVLHVAPEYAIQKNLRRRDTLDMYRSVDLRSMLALDQADVANLPYEAASFTAILCSHVLEHVDADRAAMRELYRVLEPGGWAYLQVPIDLGREDTYDDPSITEPEARDRAFGHPDHVRLYGRDYLDRLEGAGFDPHVDSFARDLSEATIDRLRLFPDEDIFIASRPDDSDSSPGR
ncbi:MAG: SAM-dependent methyltransferase [Bacteroidetes bacterium QH_10_64_19]|nr:MAG: SAM-dependent methyltransferase [Bacteroidetes bacterium QH_10_64_19]